ncbi:hypothetical protein A1O1_07282 [Capronia coronata CBS 617.96]|uniref:EthD domain-containing protein n=1 Tax=Capronia coronata CBS 617.96 TaxID=1182541 RepID=W9XTU3_9EURO|nr:uncharacterized protein A1O1_07282 [Capronia coronata CBS 617.96]EXJ83658.1 hypothetical protein A1O1_07282 [Capronia coronata CBS 617.96]
MPANATVLYPAESDATFDMAYYLKTHMPLVYEKWAKYGLTGWEVIEFAPGPDGSKPYSVAGVLHWESADNIGKAMGGEETAAVMEDVKNFSNKSPVFLIGNVVGTS